VLLLVLLLVLLVLLAPPCSGSETSFLASNQHEAATQATCARGKVTEF
jgi:Mg2+/Co2+ transporter CorB